MNPILVENLEKFNIESTTTTTVDGISIQYFKLKLKSGMALPFGEASGLDNGIRNLIIVGNYVDYISPPLAKLVQSHILNKKRNFGRQ